MINGWILTLVGILILLIAVVLLAKTMTKRDNMKYKMELEKDTEEEAQRTINEAKEWLEKYAEEGGDLKMLDVNNKHTLGELLSLEPTEEEYKEYVGKIAERVEELYKSYQFSMYEPDSADLVSGYLLQFQILGHEEIYNELFKFAMDRGLDMDKIDEYFYDALKAGDAFPVGEGIIIEREGTGISPIKSGDDVRIIVSFVTEEYQARRDEAEKKKEEQDG